MRDCDCIGADSSVVAQLDRFRKKRNIGGYERAGTVSDQEAKEMTTLAQKLRREVNLKEGNITILDRTSKTGNGRVISMTKRLRKALTKLTASRFRKGHVFTHSNGEPFREPKGGCALVERGFRAAHKQAKTENFRFHDLRHDFGSRLAAQGAYSKAIQELMGHRTSHMTDRYLHFATSHKRAAIALLETPAPKKTGQKTDKGATQEVAPSS